MKLALLLACACALPAQDLTGKWLVTLRHFGQIEYARLELSRKDAGWTGKIFGDSVTVTRTGDVLAIACQGEEKPCGKLTGRLVNGEIQASGTVYDEESRFTARRAAAIPRGGTRHEFVPKVFHNQFAALIEPALRIRAGDTVHTTTVDAGGVDEKGVHRAAGGNPLTGPFYIEGAWPGDTLVVHLTRLRLNRDSAGTYANSVVLSALDPYYAHEQKEVKGFDATWKLDREKGFAMLTKPTEAMKNFRVPLAPMLGCVGVAPSGNQAFASGRLGSFGGNMDYRGVREGVTLYLPVFHPGALLFVGDGHAAQGDGELTGNALETSMDVEFSVDLKQNTGLHQPRAEDAESLMALGIDNSLPEALQDATTGISRWLGQEYKLNAAETAMVLGSSLRYDIAEIVDPQVHVVARLPKTALAGIGK